MAKSRTTEIKIKATFDDSDLTKKLVNVSNKFNKLKNDLSSKVGGTNLDKALSDSVDLDSFIKKFDLESKKAKAEIEGSTKEIAKALEDQKKAITEKYKQLRDAVPDDSVEKAKLKLQRDADIAAIKANTKAQKEALQQQIATLTKADSAKRQLLRQQIKELPLLQATGIASINSNFKTANANVSAVQQRKLLNTQQTEALIAAEKEAESKLAAGRARKQELKQTEQDLKTLFELSKQQSTVANTIKSKRAQALSDYARQMAEEKKQRFYERRRQAAEQAANTREAASGAVGTAATAAAFFGTQATVNIVNSVAALQKLEARVRNVSLSAGEAAKNMKALTDIAIGSGQPLADTANLFVKIATGVRPTGGSNADALQLTKAFQDSIRASGTTPDQASAAAYQFSQSIGAGVLRGDELNSVIEGNIRFAQALADGLGVTVGQLKSLGEAGQLTSTRVVKAINSQSEALASAAQAVPLSPTESWRNALTQVTEEFNKLDKQFGVLSKISAAIELIGENANILVPILSTLVPLITAVSAFKAAKFAGNLLGAGALLKGATAGAGALASKAGLGARIAAGAGGAIGALGLTPAGIAAIAAIAVPVAIAIVAKERRNKFLEVAKQQEVNSGFSNLEATAESGTAADFLNTQEQLRKDLQDQSISIRGRLGLSYRNKDQEGIDTFTKALAQNEKDLKRLETIGFRDDTSSLGSLLKARAGAGIDKFGSIGSGVVSKDAVAALDALPVILKAVSGGFEELGREGSSSLGELNIALTTLVSSLNSPLEIQAGLLKISDELVNATGASRELLLQAANNLNSKFNASVEKEVKERTEGVSNTIKTYLDSITKYREFIAGNKAINTEANNVLADLDIARKGSPAFKFDAEKAINKVESTRQLNQTINNDRLKALAIERDVQLKAIETVAKANAEQLEIDKRKRQELIDERVATSQRALNRGADASKLREMETAAVEKDPRLSSAKIRESEIANVRTKEASIAAIEQNYLKERLAIQLGYLDSIDQAYQSQVENYRKYAEQIIDIEKQQKQAKEDLNKSLLDLDLEGLREEDQAAQTDSIKTGRDLEAENLAPKQVAFLKDQLDIIRSIIKNTEDQAEAERQLVRFRETYNKLLEVSRESLASANTGGDQAGEDEKRAQRAVLREQQRDFLNEEFSLQAGLADKRKADLTSAAGLTVDNINALGSQSNQVFNEADAIQKQLLNNQATKVSVALGLDENSALQLREKISNVLRDPFNIKVNTDAPSGAGSTNSTPVIINMGGRSIQGRLNGSSSDINAIFGAAAAEAGGRL